MGEIWARYGRDMGEIWARRCLSTLSRGEVEARSGETLTWLGLG